MEIGGQPIVFYLIKMLEKAGVEDVYLNCHHLADQIKHYFHNTKFGARIHLVFEPEILDTAGGVRNIVQTFSLAHRSLVVVHGDIICDFDLSRTIAANGFLPSFVRRMCWCPAMSAVLLLIGTARLLN